MAKEITYLVPRRSRETLFSTGEVLRVCHVKAGWILLLKRHRLVTTAPPSDMYRQADVDQIHNVLILKRLFHIQPESVWTLYRVFNEYVTGLSLKDTDLFRYTNLELSSDPQASADILVLTLKKVFQYMSRLATGDTAVHGRKEGVIRS